MTKLRTVSLRDRCPECGSAGPHEDNGVSKDAKLFTWLCDCGTQWEPNSGLWDESDDENT